MKAYALALATALALPGQAQPRADGAAAQTSANAEMTAGEVVKLDPVNAKITLKHAELKNLALPAMTMTFRVKDASLFVGLNAGDKVRFSAEKIGGQFIMTRIEAAR